MHLRFDRDTTYPTNPTPTTQTDKAHDQQDEPHGRRRPLTSRVHLPPQPQRTRDRLEGTRPTGRHATDARATRAPEALNKPGTPTTTANTTAATRTGQTGRHGTDWKTRPGSRATRAPGGLTQGLTGLHCKTYQLRSYGELVVQAPAAFNKPVTAWVLLGELRTASLDPCFLD